MKWPLRSLKESAPQSLSTCVPLCSLSSPSSRQDTESSFRSSDRAMFLHGNVNHTAGLNRGCTETVRDVVTTSLLKFKIIHRHVMCSQNLTNSMDTGLDVNSKQGGLLKFRFNNMWLFFWERNERFNKSV